MDRIKSVLIQEVQKYAGEGLNGYSYFTHDDVQNLFTIVAIGVFEERRIAFTALIARIVDDTIIIEEDRNSDPLYEALLQAGIPREQIVLAYAGEPVPDTA